ncbi:MAG: hypothetical protein JXR90_13420 [Spirochaetes bacterium]|nr:hypothetical protein [Spirochaetota bacterium]
MIIALNLLGLGDRKALRIRKKISQRTGIPITNILTHCFHTHAGAVPWGLNAPGDKIVKDIEANAVNAWKRLETVSIRVSFSEKEIGVNDRRKSKSITSNLGVLQFVSKSGSVPSTLVNISCHPVVLGIQNREVSADLGDKNPPPIGYLRRGGFPDAKEFGEHAASAILSMLDNSKELKVSRISVKTKELLIRITNKKFYNRWYFNRWYAQFFHPDHRVSGKGK